MKKLNGWQRLWAVICIFIGIPFLVISVNSGYFILMIGVAIFAATLLYALGLTIGWVIRGFTNNEKR